MLSDKDNSGGIIIVLVSVIGKVEIKREKSDEFRYPCDKGPRERRMNKVLLFYLINDHLGKNVQCFTIIYTKVIFLYINSAN